MFKNLSFPVIISSLLIISSCGGSGGSTPSSSAGGPNIILGAQEISAKFIDSPVEGLNFIREDGMPGQTGLNGDFKCKAGEILTFKLVNAVIGKGICGEKVFLSQLGLDVGTEETISAAMIAMTRQGTPTSSLNVLSVGAAAVSSSSLINNLASYNTFLNSVGTSGNLTQAVFDIKKLEARQHMDLALSSNASQKSDLFTWLSYHQTNYWDLSEEMDLTSYSSPSCPTDLSSVKFALSKEGAAYFLTVTVNKSGVTKTRVLTERLSASFNSNVSDPDTGKNINFVGSLSVVLSNGFNQADGFIQFKMSGGRSGNCEYPISKSL